MSTNDKPPTAGHTRMADQAPSAVLATDEASHPTTRNALQAGARAEAAAAGLASSANPGESQAEHVAGVTGGSARGGAPGDAAASTATDELLGGKSKSAGLGKRT